jgi:hypothetical protein
MIFMAWTFLIFHFACHRNARRTEQAIAKYDGADRIRVRGAGGAAVEVR